METDAERERRIAEVDRIVERTLNCRNRAATYKAAGFPEETWRGWA